MSKILVVDDDPTLVDFLKLLLESEGYDTYEASDGEMALIEIEKVQPEVVLLDYMMPNMDGLDVLRRVSNDFTASFVVMLTGKGSEEVAVECMRAGAIDYVVKPFDNERLLSVIRSAIRYRETELQKRKINDELESINQKQQQQQTAVDSFISEIVTLLQDLKQTGPEQSADKIDTVISKARKLLENR